MIKFKTAQIETSLGPAWSITFYAHDGEFINETRGEKEFIDSLADYFRGKYEEIK